MGGRPWYKRRFGIRGRVAGVAAAAALLLVSFFESPVAIVTAIVVWAISAVLLVWDLSTPRPE